MKYLRKKGDDYLDVYTEGLYKRGDMEIVETDEIISSENTFMYPTPKITLEDEYPPIVSKRKYVRKT